MVGGMLCKSDKPSIIIIIITATHTYDTCYSHTPMPRTHVAGLWRWVYLMASVSRPSALNCNPWNFVPPMAPLCENAAEAVLSTPHSCCNTPCPTHCSRSRVNSSMPTYPKPRSLIDALRQNWSNRSKSLNNILLILRE